MTHPRTLSDSHRSQASSRKIDRRALLFGSTIGVAGLATAGHYAAGWRLNSRVFIAANQRYDGPLQRTIEDGLIATGLDAASIRGKRVLLKPNLVEPSRARPHTTTHPTVIVAVADIFRKWGATVKVGEAPGHVRDTRMALDESNVFDALKSENLEFADLNYEETGWIRNRGRLSKLKGLYFPRSVLEADLIVSLPKMKTHHWVGVTGAMKNMYGTIPGIIYGWPKNVLHYNGIPETVIDINASLPPTITVVDGIECMEGDGPIMGSPKQMGLLVMGTSLPAVDATLCRLMDVDPIQIPYLRRTWYLRAKTAEWNIQQCGEAWRPHASSFQILDAPHLQDLRKRQECVT